MFRKYSSIDALKMLKLPLASTRDELYYILSLIHISLAKLRHPSRSSKLKDYLED